MNTGSVAQRHDHGGHLTFQVIVILASLQLALGAAQSSVGFCKTGRELVGLLVNPAYNTALLEEDIVLNVDDFTDFPSPILLGRNFTISGTDGKWPLLDLNYIKGKVQLLNGAALHLWALTLSGMRSKPLNMGPGLDLLLPSSPGTGTMLVVQGGIVIFRFCFPDGYTEYNYAGLMRPLGFGGLQQRLTRNISQAGCLNDTTARPAERCWPARGLFTDVVLNAVDVSEDDRQPPANYVVFLTQASFVCSQKLSAECVELQGPLACVTQALGAMRSTPPPPPPLAPSGSSPAPRNVLIPPLVCSLGGAALLGLAGVAIWVISRRQRRRQAFLDVCAGDLGPCAGAQLEVSDGKQQLADESSGDSLSGRRDTSGDLSGQQSTAHPNSREAAAPARAEALSALDRGAKAAVASAFETAGSAGDTRSVLLRDSCPSCAFVTAVEATPEVLSVVTPLTPQRADLDVGVECGNEVTLDHIALGRGSFGRVVVGTYRGEKVAVKLIGGESGLAGIPNSEVLLECLSREVEVLGRCCHPNVVRLLAACLAPPQPCLVMELMQTSLERLLHARPARLLPLQTVLHISLDIARGLEFLHPTILHRDLKPANVLINGADTARPLAKLADFGLSRLVASALVTEHPEAGTPPYMAPECFDPENFEVTHKADIYSLGVVIAEMLAGERPWRGLRLVDVACQVALMGKRPTLLQGLSSDRCPRKLSNLVMDCWDKDPQRRPAAAEVVKTLILVQQQVLTNPSASAGADMSDLDW